MSLFKPVLNKKGSLRDSLFVYMLMENVLIENIHYSFKLRGV